MNIVLASASPRRQELMGLLTDRFTVCPAKGEEIVPDTVPTALHAQVLALGKAREVAQSHPDSLVIGADTVVVAGNEILGKPHDKEDARRMLHLLSGKEHQVMTGVCLKAPGWEYTFTQTTRVWFYPMTDAEIEAYISTEEPYDKAGGYAIQGLAGAYIEKLEGDYYKVVGFPVAKIGRVLREKGLL